MNMFERAKKLWQQVNESEGVVTPSGSDVVVERSEPFVVFPCAECRQNVTLRELIYPGQVAVINCSNCQTSMAVYSPELQICRTKDLPPNVGTPIWEELSA